jgi:hypothetical protein
MPQEKIKQNDVLKLLIARYKNFCENEDSEI